MPRKKLYLEINFCFIPAGLVSQMTRALLIIHLVQEKIIFTAHNFTVFKLESMGAAPGPPHLHWTHGNAPPMHGFSLFFLFLIWCRFQPIRAETGRNHSRNTC